MNPAEGTGVRPRPRAGNRSRNSPSGRRTPQPSGDTGVPFPGRFPRRTPENDRVPEEPSRGHDSFQPPFPAVRAHRGHSRLFCLHTGSAGRMRSTDPDFFPG